MSQLRESVDLDAPCSLLPLSLPAILTPITSLSITTLKHTPSIMSGLTDVASIKRQLQIKTGVVKRYVTLLPPPSPPLPAFFQLCVSLTSSLTTALVALGRLAKEESSYLTEAKQQEERIQKFIDEERDEYDVKQQVSCFTSRTFFPSFFSSPVNPCKADTQLDHTLPRGKHLAISTCRHAKNDPRLSQEVATGC